MLSFKNKIGNNAYGQLDISTESDESIVFKLLYPIMGNAVALHSSGTKYFDCRPEQSPIMFFGPPDLYSDLTNIGDMSKWKLGPLYFIWNSDEKVWTSAPIIHHHLNNSLEQGGIAFAYFFR